MDEYKQFAMAALSGILANHMITNTLIQEHGDNIEGMMDDVCGMAIAYGSTLMNKINNTEDI